MQQQILSQIDFTNHDIHFKSEKEMDIGNGIFISLDDDIMNNSFFGEYKPDNTFILGPRASWMYVLKPTWKYKLLYQTRSEIESIWLPSWTHIFDIISIPEKYRIVLRFRKENMSKDASEKFHDITLFCQSKDIYNSFVALFNKHYYRWTQRSPYDPSQKTTENIVYVSKKRKVIRYITDQGCVHYMPLSTRYKDFVMVDYFSSFSGCGRKNYCNVFEWIPGKGECVAFPDFPSSTVLYGLQWNGKYYWFPKKIERDDAVAYTKSNFVKEIYLSSDSKYAKICLNLRFDNNMQICISDRNYDVYVYERGTSYLKFVFYKGQQKYNYYLDLNDQKARDDMETIDSFFMGTKYANICARYYTLLPKELPKEDDPMEVEEPSKYVSDNDGELCVHDKNGNLLKIMKTYRFMTIVLERDHIQISHKTYGDTKHILRDLWYDDNIYAKQIFEYIYSLLPTTHYIKYKIKNMIICLQESNVVHDGLFGISFVNDGVKIRNDEFIPFATVKEKLQFAKFIHKRIATYKYTK